MAAPVDREWQIHRRGEIREGILRDLREGLRGQIDPETGQLLTESVIRQTTAKGSRFWREADAIDLALLGVERRDEWFAQQIHIDRASTGFLDGYHGKLWGEPRLPAFGGSGKVTATGLAGTTWQGSTTVPDSFAQVALDPSGNRYQVLVTGSASGGGTAVLTLVGIDGGDETNPAPGTVMRWESPPPGSNPDAVVLEQFGGGLDAETDAAYAKRLLDRARHKPASGNWAHIRSYARAASVSVEDAFVYTCAFHAGSELVAVTQKRGTQTGPLARIPDDGVLNAVRTAIVPPGSPFVPGRVHVVVLPPVAEPSDVMVHLALPLESSAGWRDTEPFPKNHATFAANVSQIFSPTSFRLTTSQPGQLPGNPGVGVPVTGVHMMAWDPDTSTFEELTVSTVEELSPSETGRYLVTLAQAPTRELQLGDWISPAMERHAVLAGAVAAYFDSLGPGEVINLSTDERSTRAFRNPVPSEEYPQRAGQGMLAFIDEALGAPVADSQLTDSLPASPSLPSDPIAGPSLLVAGKFAVYHLES